MNSNIATDAILNAVAMSIAQLPADQRASAANGVAAATRELSAALSRMHLACLAPSLRHLTWEIGGEIDDSGRSFEIVDNVSIKTADGRTFSLGGEASIVDGIDFDALVDDDRDARQRFEELEEAGVEDPGMTVFADILGAQQEQLDAILQEVLNIAWTLHETANAEECSIGTGADLTDGDICSQEVAGAMRAADLLEAAA